MSGDMDLTQQASCRLITEQATNALAGVCADICKAPMVIYFQGELGAGKTTFIRAWLFRLGVEGKVKSPTYTLVEPYHFTDYDVYHFDLYRLKSGEELLSLGIDDYVNHQSLCFIEWPEKGEDNTPLPDLTCQLNYIDETTRQITFAGVTQTGQHAVNLIKNAMVKV